MLPMMSLSVAIAVVTGAAGLVLSYYAGTAAGASVAAVLVAVYLLAAIGSRGRPPTAAVEETP
jgi:ABC-type Mn2+/Zn2+ transport system permease subunit